MKCFAILLALFSAPWVHADCLDTWLTYRSSTLSLSVDYSEGCYHGELIINSKFFKGDPQGNSVLFDRECHSSKVGKDGEPIQFSCRKDGETPLAGATYRYKSVKAKYRCKDGSIPLPERSFICIRGCKPTVPRELEVEYSEGAC
jgi:hypothetical protein